jgi:hypothetical protein
MASVAGEAVGKDAASGSRANDYVVEHVWLYRHLANSAGSLGMKACQAAGRPVTVLIGGKPSENFPGADALAHDGSVAGLVATEIRSESGSGQRKVSNAPS